MTEELKNLTEELTEYLNEGISEFCNSTKEISKLQFNDFVELRDRTEYYAPYVVVEFYGGLNGSGNWVEYMKDITSMFNILQSEYNCWLVNLENDCPDDVFTLKIGIRKNDTCRSI
jgi:D-serine dehydratase